MSRRPKPKPYAPRVETLEMRRMMSRSSDLVAATVSVKPALDAFAWELLENPGVVADRHLGKLANQLGGQSASAVAQVGLGVLLVEQLAKEPGYAAQHGLGGLIHSPASTLSALAVDLSASPTHSSIRPDLDSFAWTLLDKPGLVKKLKLGTLATQLGQASAAAIAKYGLGGILAKDLSREPGYAARHQLSGLIPTPVPAPVVVVQPAPVATSGPVIAPSLAGSTEIAAGAHPNIIPAIGFSFFTECSGCQQTAAGALVPGAGIMASLRGIHPFSVGGTNSDIGLADGSYFQNHSIVPYTSQGTLQGVDLSYSSTQANPHPIVQFVVTIPSSGYSPVTISSFSAQLSIDGVSQGAAVTYNASGVTAGSSFLVALRGDATSLTTGVHNDAITFITHRTSGGDNTINLTNTVNVVNAAASPYGGGWSVNGLQAITTNSLSTSALITAGAQGTEQYTYDGSSYSGPPSDKSTLVQNSGGTWTRTYTDGTVLQFNSSGQETSMADRNGNTTNYAYVSSGAAAGALATITDPVGLVTTLSYNGSGKLSTITDPAHRVTTVTVDSSGNLTQITDPDSTSVSYGYSTPSIHAITTESSSNGATATVTYDSYGLVQSESLFGSTGTSGVGLAQEQGLLAPGGTGPLVLKANPNATAVDPLGHTVSFTFDSMYDPIAQSDGTGATTTIVRDANDWPTVVTDPLGRTTTTSYDSSGNVTGMVRPDGTSMAIVYGTDSQPTQVTDYRGLITTFTLDSHGNTTRQTDPDGQHADWTYNSAGQVLTATDRNSHTTSFAYDSLDRVTTITYPGTGTPSSTIAYNSAGDPTVVTDELGHATTLTYDQAGRVLSMQDPIEAAAGKATSYTYDADGNLTSVTDALGHVVSYAYDSRDRLTTMVDAANHGTGQATVFAYNGMNLTSVTDPNGHSTTFSYDGDNRQTGSTDALGHRTTVVYDAAGEVLAAVNANGNATSYTYDAEGRVATQESPGTAANLSGSLISPITTYTYNADNQVVTATDALNHTTTISYDNLGRETAVTDALNHTTSYGYDLAGNQTTMTDPLGHVTSYAYDSRNRQVSVTEPSGGGTTSYTYDNASNLLTVTDPVNNVTSYSYDANNREATETMPTGGVTTYTYDLVGNLTQKVDPLGRISQYGYDADNRETTEKWFSGGTAFYTMTLTYDAAGRVTEVQDNNSEYTYGYDNANRLTTINDAGTTGLPQVTMTYGYDTVGNRTSLSDTQGGVVSYTYDVRNELTTLTQSGSGVSSERVDLVYDAAGRMTTLTRYSDTSGTSVVAQTVNAYDSANRLTTTTNATSTGSTISSYIYNLDAASRLTSEVRTWTLSGTSYNDTATYGYTNNNQLTSATHTNSSFTSESFSYDSNGNRNSAGNSTGAGNELSSDGTYNYTYDADGNMSTKTSIATGVELEYTWDYRNRLTEVQQVSSGVTTTVAQYTYDALNRLIEVVEGGSSRSTLYDGQTPLLDFNGSGTVTVRYLSIPGAIDEILARQTSSGVAWYLTDREGSVNDIINNSGTVIDHIDYSAYGTVLAESSPSSGDRFKYAGMELDGATGLYYDRARWYDAASGRFVSVDPSGFRSGDSDLFRYTGNNPSNWVDASGLDFSGLDFLENLYYHPLDLLYESAPDIPQGIQAGLGLLQGGADILNGLGNVEVGLINTLSGVWNYTGGWVLPNTGYLPTTSWSQDLFVSSELYNYNFNTTVGGTGVSFLIPGGACASFMSVSKGSRFFLIFYRSPWDRINGFHTVFGTSTRGGNIYGHFNGLWGKMPFSYMDEANLAWRMSRAGGGSIWRIPIRYPGAAFPNGPASSLTCITGAIRQLIQAL